MIIIIIRIRAAFVKAVNVKVTVLVDVIPCHLVSAVRMFRRNLHSLHANGRRQGMQFVLVVQDIALNIVYPYTGFSLCGEVILTLQ